jgi:hypothetical protein
MVCKQYQFCGHVKRPHYLPDEDECIWHHDIHHRIYDHKKSHKLLHQLECKRLFSDNNEDTAIEPSDLSFVMILKTKKHDALGALGATAVLVLLAKDFQC